MNFWSPVSINRSGRPVLRQNESVLFIRDNIGLYQGRCKITNRQQGRIYLTNHRIIYVDDQESDRSMAVSLDAISRTEVVDKFLTSSAKVKLYVDGTNVGLAAVPVDWVCKICSFNNHLDEMRCASCGVSRARTGRRAAAAAAATGATPTATDSAPAAGTDATETASATATVSQSIPPSAPSSAPSSACPKCTYHNHPSLKYCEMCGSALTTAVSAPYQGLVPILLDGEESYLSQEPYIKLSFHNGGEAPFHTALSAALDENKWAQLAQSGNVNKGATKINQQLHEAGDSPTANAAPSASGIHKLQLLSEQTRKHNEVALATSLADLEQLMYKAKDLMAISTSFGQLVPTRPRSTAVVAPLNIPRTAKFYHEELARHLSEYLMAKLTKTSSMITTQDFYAEYNRYLVESQGVGVQMMAVGEFSKAIELFEPLKLPVAVRHYEGLVVLRPRYGEDGGMVLRYVRECAGESSHDTSTTSAALRDWAGDWRRDSPRASLHVDQDQLTNPQTLDVNYRDESAQSHHDPSRDPSPNPSPYIGITVKQLAAHFSWSIDIATAELTLLVDKGLLVIDCTVQGTVYYLNQL